MRGIPGRGRLPLAGLEPQPEPPPRSGKTRAEEARLIAAARKGDPKALHALLEHASGPAERFSRGFCRDPHDSEDLVQEVLISLLRSLKSFRGDASLSTWTYTVARRACMRMRRRKSRLTSLDDEPGAHDVHADRAAEPPRRHERRELGAALERSIGALPMAQREVLVLRDVEGLTAHEVGKILGLGERAVKSRLHRARLVLREQLAPFAPGGAGPEPGPGCPDTARMLSRYLEGELDPSVCARIEGHVAACASCGAACESLRFVLGTCKEYGERTLPGELRRAVRAAIREAVKAAPA